MKKILLILIFIMFVILPIFAQADDFDGYYDDQAPLSQQDIDKFLKIYEDLQIAIKNQRNYDHLLESVGWDIDRGIYVMAKFSCGRITLDHEINGDVLGPIPEVFQPSAAELELIKPNLTKFDEIDARNGWQK